MSLKFTRLLLLLLCMDTWWACAQTTAISGYVREKGSHEPVAFAHIILKGAGNIGTTSDTAGYFMLSVNNGDIITDTLIISSLGYGTAKAGFVANTSQTAIIELEPEFQQMEEFTVTPGENQAWHILRDVIAHKNGNNPDLKANYRCNEYSKIRFDLNHFTDKIKKNILLRPFGYIWDNVDTTPDGVTYLPVLLVEKEVAHYYQSSPKIKKDYVNAINTKGLAGPKIMKFAGDLYQAPNFYDNFIVILDKSFPSPLNDNYKNNYKFYLVDSSGSDTAKTYKITFHPKQKRDLAFTGEMIIDSTHAALKEITVRFDIMANVNFVRSFWINQKYAPVNGRDWMLDESSVIGDFTVIENSSDLTGFFGRKNSTFHNYVVDSTLPAKVLKGAEQMVETDSAKLRNETWWIARRDIGLTKEDKGIFGMVDSLEKDPKFIVRKKIIVAVATGYYPVRGIDIGDIYTFYSYNSIEHSRPKLGFRSNQNSTFPLSGAAYGAYGALDGQWKYGLNANYAIGKDKKHWSAIGISYRYDIDQLGRSFNNIELDNIFSSFVQLGNIDASRNYAKDIDAYAEQTWATGLVTRMGYFSNTLTPTRGTEFDVLAAPGNIMPQNNYHAAGIALTLKYSWQNNKLNGAFYDKNDFKSTFKKYPDVNLQWKHADKNLFASGFDFNTLKVSLKQQVRTQKLGYFKYYIEAGTTFGTVPYPYLDIPYGNQLVLFDEYAFNLMNFLEYAADKYAAVYLEQHIEGLLLDRIPLVNRLKWRNFVFAKGYFASLSHDNATSKYLFPQNLQPATGPYYEAGFGIENIFKLGRMDFIWRMTDVNKPNVYYFIVKPSLKFAF